VISIGHTALKHLSRYFNASGADPRGEIGECHQPEPQLVPRVLMPRSAAAHTSKSYGTDYEPADGTCVTRFIHRGGNLADAHVLAAHRLGAVAQPQLIILVPAEGYSVKQVVAAAERVTGSRIGPSIGDRRPGDPPFLYQTVDRPNQARVAPARSMLVTQIGDAWRWHKTRFTVPARIHLFWSSR